MEEELEKRNVAAMARSNMFPVKRSYDESSAGGKVNNLKKRTPFSLIKPFFF